MSNKSPMAEAAEENSPAPQDSSDLRNEALLINEMFANPENFPTIAVIEGLLETFDERLTTAERRMDRILAQLGVE